MKISFFKIIFVLMFGILCFSPFIVRAGSTDNMSGYAWSSNIGWISFNCTNNSSCATSDYGVNKDEVTGNLTGYAWSPNIGWIQFGGLSGFPTGDGAVAQNAQVVGGNLIGWAKAVAGGIGSSGWDGWIALSGTGYGVSFDSNTFLNYAWGSDVVGWIKFDGVVVGEPELIMSGILTADNCVILEGNSDCVVDLSWSINNTEAISSAITSNGIDDIILNTPTIGDSYLGTESYTFTASATRTFYLYNNAQELATATAIATCDTGTGWNGAMCVATPVNGSCSSPADHNNPCLSGTLDNYLDGPSAYTWDCLGSNGGIDNLSCSENKIPNGSSDTCSSVHYLCGDGSIGTNQRSSPSVWKWTCNGTPCSERKSPEDIEG